MAYRQVKLGEIARIIRGVSYKSSDYSSADDANAEAFVNLKCVAADGFRRDGVKYFNGKHKPNQSVHTGDLLIANTDLTRNREVIGNSILVPELDKPNACFSMDLSKIEILNTDELEKEFLYYYLKSPKARWHMINHSDGSTVVHLPVSAVPELIIDLPDLEIQEKIVRILSALDQKIELNNQQSNNITRIIKTLYKNVSGTINEKTKLADVAKIASGKRPMGINDKDTYEVVGARDVMGFTGEYNQEPGVIITGRVGTLGVIKRYPRKIWASDNTLIVDTEYKNYIECFLSSADFNSYNRGSTQPLITQTDLKNFVLPFEEKKCLDFEKETTPLRNKIFTNEKENERLANLRDALLPKLLSVEINLEKINL